MQNQLEQHIRNREYAAALAVSRQLYDAARPVPEIAAMHGHVLQQLGLHREARPVLEQARQLLPNLPSIWIDLANACIAAADWEAAAAAVARFRSIAPQSAAGIFAEAQVQLGKGHRDRADVLFLQATSQHANFLNRRLRLAAGAFDAGDFVLADWHYQACISRHPDSLHARLDYLASLFQQRKYPQAAAVAKAALARWPDNTRLLSRYSALLDLVEADIEEKLRAREQWLQCAPDSPEAHVAIANALATVNDLVAAHVHWRRAQELDPAQPIARWAAMHFPGQFVFATEDELAAFARHWEDELDHFETLALPAADVCLRLVQCCSSHYLMYARQDIRTSLQRRARLLAQMCDRAMAEPLRTFPALIASTRRRVGVVSPSFGWHSVSRVWRELLLGVDRSKIELICFNVECSNDDSVAQWRQRADVFVDAQGDLLSWHHRLGATALDVLIFLDLGPDTICQALATRRYAPVQCTTWAFPVTSGSAAIDYFLSSDLMEPEQGLAQSHYSEMLVRLPGLACSYQPDALRAEAAPRSADTSSSAAPRYLCAQTASKILPVHDALFAEILAGNPNSVLALSHGGRQVASDALRERIKPALMARSIDVEQRLDLQARLPFVGYMALLARTDVILDTLHFSGCLTSLDALSMDIPIVTLPGATMRGRQTAAMLRLLELPELIARDQEDYVRIAIELGRDEEWRNSIRQRIGERKHRLYEFSDSVRGLEDFLTTVQPR